MIADAFRPGTFVDAFRFMADDTHLLLQKTADHLALSSAAIGIAAALALPLGLALGHLRRGSFVAIGISNVGRALPSTVLIALGLSVFGLGFWNTTAALVVLAVPPILTNAYVGVAGVDAEIVEAARGMGMSGAQVLRRVELPLALPLVLVGLRIATIFVVATATIAAVAGGGGLGDVIFDQASYRLSGIVAASIWVAALALGLSALLGVAQRLVSRSRHRAA